MRIGARNELKGKVLDIEKGAVNSVIRLDIGGGNEIIATISLAAIDELNLQVGSEAYAIIKASSVIIGVED